MNVRYYRSAWTTVVLVIGGLLLLNGNSLGCSRKKTAKPPQVTDTGSAAEEGVDSSASEVPRPKHARKPEAKPQAPLTDDVLLALRQDIEHAKTYPARIAARRTLLYALCREDRIDEAMPEFESILDNVEQQEGRAMAQRVAYNDAGNLVGQGMHRAAVKALHLLLDRYGDGPFAADALMQIGTCHLELREYGAAAQAWQRLIEEYDGSPTSPWGWRKLALVQLLQGQYDASLATLEIMASKYADSHFAEYAKMRRGYVLMAANRLPEARASYTRFLKECSNSKYCRLAKKQLGEMNEAIASARAVEKRN